MSDDVGERLRTHPRFRWREGMRDRRGLRVVELDLWDGPVAPDLEDFPTAGALIGLLDETGLLTDVVREGGEWIVAVELPEDGLQGWASDVFGEAVAHALFAAWDAVPDRNASA